MQKTRDLEYRLTQLHTEREQADREYNDALTALDRAVSAVAAFNPEPPPGPDSARLDELNAGWEVIGSAPVAATGWRGRIAGVVWRIVAPLFQRQQAFNAALVDHLNRAHTVGAQGRDGMAALAEGIREQARTLAHFQSVLIQYLQRITPYVDTKDRYHAGELRLLVEERANQVGTGIDAVGEELLRRSEAMLARERRLQARLDVLAQALRGVTGEPGGPREEAPASTPPDSLEATERSQLAKPDAAAAYAGFEDLFRGNEREITDRFSAYLPLFAGAREVLDIGCGRGEFLRALGGLGVHARGVDLNPEMVRRCRERGLDVALGDALEHLAGLPDGSLDGIFAAQVIEHLPPDRLFRLLTLAHGKMRPGGKLVLETLNPACWAAFFSSYILDLTHVRPIHPETLRYLVGATGFEPVEIIYSSPYPPEDRLRRVPLSLSAGTPDLKAIMEALNDNVEILNTLMFGHLDYACVGTRRDAPAVNERQG